MLVDILSSISLHSELLASRGAQMTMTRAAAQLILGAVLLTASAAPSGTHISPCRICVIGSATGMHAELASLGCGACEL